MNWTQSIDGLELDHNSAFNQEIQLVATIQFRFFLDEGNWLLSLEIHVSHRQLVA